MKTAGTLLMFVLRLVCYVALAIVLVGIGSLVLVSGLDVCPTLHEGGVSCNEPVYQHIAEFGMTVMLVTVFTGLPALLAMGGIAFLAWDIAHWRRRRRQGAIAEPKLDVSAGSRPQQWTAAGAAGGGMAKLILKVVLIFLALAISAGVIAGLVEALQN